jgi:hypothetical protein
LLPKYVVTTNGNDEDKLKQQQRFVVRLIEEIRSGSEVLYFDETSLNLWDHRRKIWMTK